MAPLPPLAAGTWNGWMATPFSNSLAGTVAPLNDGAVSDTSTSISAVSRFVSPAWAAASTRTLSFASAASIVPLQERLSVALVLPDAPPETLPTLRPATAGLVTSSKLAAPTPLANVVLSSDTVTAAPLRVAAVRTLGEAMDAVGTATATVSVVRSMLRLWAAALTFTARVRSVLMLPVKARVSVARRTEARNALAMETLGMSVTSSKSDFVMLPPKKNLPADRSTLTVAPFRFASVRLVGVVDAIVASPTSIANVRLGAVA